MGTVTVKATKAADDIYKSATAEYTVKSIKYPQEEFKFENSNPSIDVEFKTGEYTNKATGGSGEGSVTYELVSGSGIVSIDANTGKVTFIKAGQVIVKAIKAADNNYIETTATYTLNIKKSEQDALNVTAPTSITFKTDAQDVLSVSGGSGTGDIRYSIVSGGEYASIDGNGKITTIKAGTITVKVEKFGDDGYNDATPVTKDILIERAAQSRFAFTYETPDAITYNDNNNEYTNTVVGGNGTGTVSYVITDGADVADIDPDTGKLSIKKAGTVSVKATKAQDDCYKAATATYSLTINKDTPEFSVDDINLTYGTTQKQIDISEVSNRVGTGIYKYEIISANNIGASVNAAGLITFVDSAEKTGTVTIKITKEADDQYSELSKEITVTVSYLIVAERPVITGDTKNDSGWYTGNVIITAPTGYRISYYNKLSTSDWDSSVQYVNQGDNPVDVYLKRESDGYITGAINFDSIKLDTDAPNGLKISYDTGFWQKVLETVTFGIYEADTVNITLSATDTTSSVDYFMYNIGEGDIRINSNDFTSNTAGVATYTFTLPANFRNKVSMTATDVAGNQSVITRTDRILVVDTDTPVLTVSYDSSKSGETTQNHNKNSINGKIYSNQSITVRFEITESNFDLRKQDPTFKIGSLPVALTWNKDTVKDVWYAEATMESEGVYDLVLNFADASGNAFSEYTQTVIVDKTAPIINDIEYTGTDVTGNIFNTNREAEITMVT